MAGESVIVDALNDARSHRVAVHIGDQLGEIRWITDVLRTIATLPHAPGSAGSQMGTAAELILNSVHSSPERHRCSSNHDVKVVRHDAPREHLPAVALLDVPNQLDEVACLPDIRKNGLTARNAVVHVIQTACDDDSRPTSH